MKNAIALFLILAVGPLLAASPFEPLVPSACYGLDNGFCASIDTSTRSAPLTVLPGDFAILTDRQVTLTVTLPAPVFGQRAVTWGGAPTVTGTVLSSSAQAFSVACGSTCVIAAPALVGALPGDVITVRAVLVDPDALPPTTLSDTQIVVAKVIGQYNAVAWVLNPASNLNQRTFLRIIAPDNAATVQLFATDDNGDRRGPVAIRLNAGESMQITPDDLENGNAGKGIDGFGSGVGKWRVDMTSDSRFRAIALSTGLSELPVD